mgnify:CR=1 FL=1|tara:strand:+ start:4413 stop:4610 length:198 start_codon:yes stop_codon:yes gene_type:complete
MDGFLFLNDSLDLLLVIGYLLLLISVTVLIMIARYHIGHVKALEKQVDYWRQQALSENKRSINVR